MTKALPFRDLDSMGEQLEKGRSAQSFFIFGNSKRQLTWGPARVPQLSSMQRSITSWALAVGVPSLRF